MAFTAPDAPGPDVDERLLEAALRSSLEGEADHEAAQSGLHGGDNLQPRARRHHEG